MKAHFPLALVAIGVSLLAPGCGASDADGASAAAHRLYAAVNEDDGVTACEQLSDDTRKQLVSEERKPCPEAILDVELSGTRSIAASAYVTEAKVDLDGGDSVFLEETDEGWKVTAAGCRPAPGEETPYDCELES
jgi:hypothetical protein